MTLVWRRALKIVFRPAAQWDELRLANPPWHEALLRHALPLALLPACAWPLGQAASGTLAATPQILIGAFAATLLFSLSSVVALALGFLVLCPLFEIRRNWNRAMTVAAYASTPVLLAGALLVVPILVIASVGALFHTFVLCYLGVRQVLGCREGEAAGFVAAAAITAGFLSMLLGGLCSAMGLI